MSKEKKFYTSFLTASSWNNTNLVLCNNVPKIDGDIYYSLYDTFGYDMEEDDFEVYQWYITDLSQRNKEYLENTFDIKFIFSEVLDCYVLPILHYGTSWDYVKCEVFSSQWVEFNKDKLI